MRRSKTALSIIMHSNLVKHSSRVKKKMPLDLAIDNQIADKKRQEKCDLLLIDTMLRVTEIPV